MTPSRPTGPDSTPGGDPTATVARHQRLLDVYGALLTEHQREACRLHLDEDWSYAELAEQLGCSRSAAHDLVRRAIVQLEHYETRLGHAAELARRDDVEAELRRRIARMEGRVVAGRGQITVETG